MKWAQKVVTLIPTVTFAYHATVIHVTAVAYTVSANPAHMPGLIGG